MDRTKRIRSYWIGSGAVAALALALGWQAMSTAATAVGEDAPAIALEAPSQAATTPEPAAEPSPHEIATPPADSVDGGSREAKDRLAAASDHQGHEHDDLIIPELEGPRPDASSLAEEVDSDERHIEKMGAEVVAQQKDTMATRLDERAARVRERLLQAQGEGDEANIQRLEIRLARLDGRVAHLTQRSAELRGTAPQGDERP